MSSAPPWMKKRGRGSSELITATGLDCESREPVRSLNSSPASHTKGVPGSLIARRAKQRHHGAHRVAEEADPRVGDALAGEGDDRLQLQHLFDPEGDGRAVAPGPPAIRVQDDVEAFAP